MALDKRFLEENILTISATEWAEMNGEDISEYEPKGIIVAIYGSKRFSESFEEFLRVIPEDAEVIVDFGISPNYALVEERPKQVLAGLEHILYGTALIKR